ncbi:uncharacterized protein LOC132738849 [Ruditapes philippinarum]|uniref:uncharacterized protein LOC132738849 n=1 Tax=Ruditapes philippinarum TaxID=129788 RepID=UPI00295AFE13|nr:uncharacterized protein LOC132738849 [Ruditapes philippinarum]
MSGFKQLILLLLFRICVATVPYNKFMTWNRSKNACTLATPELVYDGKIFTVKEDQNMTNDMDGRWLGYYRNMRGFEYFGCFKNPEIFGIPSTQIVQNSPGNCFSLCSRRGTVVGLMGHECYCFNTTTAEQNVVSNASCAKPCEAPSEGLACGGQSFISLYVVNRKVLKVSNVINSKENKSNCVRLGSNNLWWDKCNGWLHSICNNGTAVYNVFAPATVPENLPWYWANNLCFGSDVRPLLYENAVNFNGTTLESWTGMCRSLSIFTFSEPIIGNDYLEYGYLKRSDTPDRYEIQFTSNFHERKKSLCKGDIQTAKEQQQTNDGDDSGAAAIAAGVSVASVVVIAAIVVFIILRRRKKMAPVLCCKTTTRNQNLENELRKQEHVDKERRESNEYALPHHGIADPNIEASSMENSYPHTYFVLEKTGKETNNVKGIYNIAGPINCTDIENQQNNYDRRRKLGEHATYDRVQNAQVGMKNNEYDTTETVAAKLSMHTSPKGDTHDCQEAEGDTYNHITGDLSKHIKTDNVYGTQYQADECSGEGYSSEQRTTAVEEDNYSHIHNA